MHEITHTRDLKHLPDEFCLFSFGANNIENLAKRFFSDPNVAGTKEEVDVIAKHTTPAFLHGYLRTFFGYSKRWRGSVGSLTPTCEKDKGVYGLLTHFKKDPSSAKFFIGDKIANLKALCNVEAVDSGMYRLKHVGNLQGDIFVYAFVGCHKKFPAKGPPSRDYLNAIGKTVSYNFPRSHYIYIPIRYGDNPKITGEYLYHNM